MKIRRQNRLVSEADYRKAIERAVSRLSELNEHGMRQSDFEEVGIAVANRLKAQIQIAVLLSRGWEIGEIADRIGVGRTSVGRYLDGKITPKPDIAAEIETLYDNRRQRRAKKSKG